MADWMPEPVAWLYRDEWGTLKLAQTMPPPKGAFAVYAADPEAVDNATLELGQLLSRIHADYGQYIALHGWRKAATDALAKISAAGVTPSDGEVTRTRENHE